MSRLSLEAKAEIVRKALKIKGKTRRELAEQYNIGYSTLQKWIKTFKENNSLIGKQEKQNEWNQKAKFNHLLTTAELDEKAISAYCREHGLYSFQLTEWKQEFMANTEKSQKSKQSSELKALKAEIKKLKRELHRKDKALAETSALLVLKKKADLIWGDDEDA